MVYTKEQRLKNLAKARAAKKAKAKRGEGLGDWLKAGKDFVKKNKLVSKGLRHVSGLLPNQIASTIGMSLADKAEAKGWGKKGGARTKLDMGLIP